MHVFKHGYSFHHFKFNTKWLYDCLNYTKIIKLYSMHLEIVILFFNDFD